MNAKCSECGFETQIKFKKKELGRGLEETYFRCDFCHVHMTCFITNGKVRRMQKELKNEKNLMERQAKQGDINKIMDELLEKYGRR